MEQPQHRPELAEPPTDIIPTQMEPISGPNEPLDPTITKDMHQLLKIEQIHLSENYPCVLDENSLGNKSPIYCHCENYNSEFHRSSGQQQKQRLIRCHKCKRYVHYDC